MDALRMTHLKVIPVIIATLTVGACSSSDPEQAVPAGISEEVAMYQSLVDSENNPLLTPTEVESKAAILANDEDVTVAQMHEAILHLQALEDAETGESLYGDREGLERAETLMYRDVSLDSYIEVFDYFNNLVEGEVGNPDESPENQSLLTVSDEAVVHVLTPVEVKDATDALINRGLDIVAFNNDLTSPAEGEVDDTVLDLLDRVAGDLAFADAVLGKGDESLFPNRREALVFVMENLDQYSISPALEQLVAEVRAQ